MKILISNDDGYLAPGIIALADALSSLAEITVVAPDSNRSGCSNSLTLERPLSVGQAANGFYFVNGTPSDCIDGLAVVYAGSGGVGHQPGAEHGRRHAVLGHRGGSDRGLSVRHSRDCIFPG
jgi:hypothetical protein